MLFAAGVLGWLIHSLKKMQKPCFLCPLQIVDLGLKDGCYIHLLQDMHFKQFWANAQISGSATEPLAIRRGYRLCGRPRQIAQLPISVCELQQLKAHPLPRVLTEAHAQVRREISYRSLAAPAL